MKRFYVLWTEETNIRSFRRRTVSILLFFFMSFFLFNGGCSCYTTIKPEPGNRFFWLGNFFSRCEHQFLSSVFFFFSSKLRFKHIVTAWLWVFYGSYSSLSEPAAVPTSRRTYLWKHWRSRAQLDRPQQLLIKLLRVLISSNSTLYLLMSSLQPSPTLLK